MLYFIPNISYLIFFDNYLVIISSFLFDIKRKQTGFRDLHQQTKTCSKLTIKTVEKGVKYVQSWRRSAVFIVNFNTFHTFFWCFYYSFWTGKCLLGLVASRELPILSNMSTFSTPEKDLICIMAYLVYLKRSYDIFCSALNIMIT